MGNANINNQYYYSIHRKNRSYCRKKNVLQLNETAVSVIVREV
jgi:hypothetical protein